MSAFIVGNCFFINSRKCHQMTHVTKLMMMTKHDRHHLVCQFFFFWLSWLLTAYVVVAFFWLKLKMMAMNYSILNYIMMMMIKTPKMDHQLCVGVLINLLFVCVCLGCKFIYYWQTWNKWLKLIKKFIRRQTTTTTTKNSTRSNLVEI